METQLSPVGLAENIKNEFHLLQNSVAATCKHVVSIGESLVAARSQIDHGSWEDWVTKHCPFSPRMARKYIHAYEHRAEIEANRNHGSDFGISTALKLIGRKPSDPGPQEKPAPQLGAVEVIPPPNCVDDHEQSCNTQARLTVVACATDPSDSPLEPEVIEESMPIGSFTQASGNGVSGEVATVTVFEREATSLLERLEIFIKSQAGSSLPRLIRDLERILELARRRSAETSAAGGA